MTSLSSLPFNVLLGVFRELDDIGLIRLGMVSILRLSFAPGWIPWSDPPFETQQTSKSFSEITRDRQVWVDQLEKLCQEDSVLKPATPLLTSFSTQELKTLVIDRTKLHCRFNKDHNNFDFAAQGTARIPGVCDILLLPGGKYLLSTMIMEA